MIDLALLAQRGRAVRIRPARNTLQSLARRLRLPVRLVRRLARLPMYRTGAAASRKSAAISTLVVESRTINAEDILTSAELAGLLKVKESWLREKTRKRCRNPIPYLKLGKYIRYDWNAVSAWLQSTATNGANRARG